MARKEAMTPEELQALKEAVKKSRYHYCLVWGLAVPPVAIGSYSAGYEAHNACPESRHVDVIPCVDEALLQKVEGERTV